MRCLLVVAALAAAVDAATISQSVSAGGSAGPGEMVSVSETASMFSSDSGPTLGTRSSFSSSRRQSATDTALYTPAADQRPPPVAAQKPRPAPAKAPRPVAAKRPRPAVATKRPRPAVATKRPRPVITKRPRPVITKRPRVTYRPYVGSSGTGPLSSQSGLGGAVPVVPIIRPLKLNINVPSLVPVGGGLGTRFNNRASSPAAAAPAAVVPALASVQSSLDQVAHRLNNVASSLGV